MTKTREDIITSMCMTYRHDYGLVKENTDLLSSGMTPAERSALWHRMAQVFDNDIAPYMAFNKSKESAGKC